MNIKTLICSVFLMLSQMMSVAVIAGPDDFDNSASPGEAYYANLAQATARVLWHPEFSSLGNHRFTFQQAADSIWCNIDNRYNQHPGRCKMGQVGDVRVKKHKGPIRNNHGDERQAACYPEEEHIKIDDTYWTLEKSEFNKFSKVFMVVAEVLCFTDISEEKRHKTATRITTIITKSRSSVHRDRLEKFEMSGFEILGKGDPGKPEVFCGSVTIGISESAYESCLVNYGTYGHWPYRVGPPK